MRMMLTFRFVYTLYCKITAIRLIVFQKNGSWAVRNMVSRSRYQCSKFIDLGVEPILKKDLKKFNKFEYDMKAALRDLGCQVDLKEAWTGKGGLLTSESKH